MLVFSAFTPNSPLLLESIGKEQSKKLTRTREAMQELADELYAVQPDTIVLISEHPTSHEDAFSINLSDPFSFDLSEFGDLGFEMTFRPRIMLIDRLQRSLRRDGQPVTLTSDEKLHFASAVPLALLTQQLPDVKLVPITYSDLGPKEHFQFGQALKDRLMTSKHRIALIASGDMSHALTSDSPAGFNKAGKQFDAKIQELIATKNSAGLLSLDQDLIQNAHERCYKPLLLLFGILERVSVNPAILSYEAPFGVGHMVTNFTLR